MDSCKILLEKSHWRQSHLTKVYKQTDCQQNWGEGAPHYFGSVMVI